MGRKFHLQTGVTGPANAWSPLHYVPLRLACGNPSIPGRRFIRRANRAFVVSAFFCPRRLEPTLAFAGCSLRFYLFQYPAQIHTPRKPRTCFFRFLLSSSVRTDAGICRVLSQVLPVPVPLRRFIHRANRAPVVLLSSVFVGYNRRWLLPAALSGFTCSSTRRSSIRRANRTLVFSAFFCLRRLEPTLAFAGCSLRFYLFQYPCAVHSKKIIN